MAFRIDKAVVRGEISNEERGIVAGEIWLAGRPEPLRLRLRGNCLRDLAGCRLEFSRPDAEADPSLSVLETEQHGAVGEMTGSRKSRRTSTADLLELMEGRSAAPSTVVNSLYLEWYSEANGRVVIDSTDFKLRISLPAWTMTPEEEEEQLEASQECFHRFIDSITGGLPHTSGGMSPLFLASAEADLLPDEMEFEPGQDDEPESFLPFPDDDTSEGLPLLDEFEWEQELRDADRRAEAYQEAFEKYREHPDRERLIAEALGWEEGIDPDFDDSDELSFADAASLPTPPRANSEWEEELDLEAHHPLSQKAMDFALALQREAEEHGLMSEPQDARDSPILLLILHIISLGGKLAGALDGWAQGLDPEPGFIIAMLKRAQVPLNEALHAFDCIDTSSLSEETHLWLQRRKRDLFELRREIIDVMQQLRSR